MSFRLYPPHLVIVAAALLFIACSNLDLQWEYTGSPTGAPPETAASQTPAGGRAADVSPVETATLPGRPARTGFPAEQEWDSDWLHFGVDNTFSSCNPKETVLDPENVAGLQQLWGAGCNDMDFSIYFGTPALYQGKLIATHAPNLLDVHDPLTGGIHWQIDPHTAVAWSPPPVVSADGVVYILQVADDASSLLLAYSAEDGNRIWASEDQFRTGFNGRTQVTVDEEADRIYLVEDAMSGGRLFAIDRRTGETAWSTGSTLEIKNKPTFHGDYVPLMDGKLFVRVQTPIAIDKDYSIKQDRLARVDAASQTIDIIYDAPSGTDGMWVSWFGLCGDFVFESYQEWMRPAEILVAHRTDEPGIVWRIDVPGTSGRPACNSGTGAAYIPTGEGLLAVDIHTGKTLWQAKTSSSALAPTVANGVVYFLSGSNLNAVDERTGETLFRFPLGVEADASTGVMVSNGLAAFSGSGGTCDLYVLGLT